MLVGRVRGQIELGPGEDQLDRLVEQALVGVQLEQPRGPPGELLDPLAEPSRLVPTARASEVICLPARGTIASITRGRIVALVSACGIRSVLTSDWQIT